MSFVVCKTPTSKAIEAISEVVINFEDLPKPFFEIFNYSMQYTLKVIELLNFIRYTYLHFTRIHLN